MIQVHIRDKTIAVDAVKRLVIGGQTGADTIRFVVQKTYREEIDLSGWTWYLQFRNKNGEGESVLLSKTFSGELIYLDWTPGVTATQVSGRMEIQLYATSGDSKWVSAPATIYVEENLTPDAIIPTTPTVLDQYLELFEELKDDAETAESNASDSAAAALISEEAAAASAISSANSATSASTSKDAAISSATGAAGSASSANTAKLDAQAAASVAVGAAGTAVGGISIDGVQYVVGRAQVNGHIIKTITQYEGV